MISKDCLEELRSRNIFLSKIKPKDVIEMIEGLISDGKELFSRYKKYDESILVDIHFRYEPKGFSEDTVLTQQAKLTQLFFMGLIRYKSG